MFNPNYRKRVLVPALVFFFAYVLVSFITSDVFFLVSTLIAVAIFEFLPIFRACFWS